MQIKKNPKQTLENYSKIFMQLGLVVALFVAYLVIEQKSYQENVSPSGDVIFTVDPEEEPPIVKVKEPEIPPKKPVILDDREVVNDDEDIEEVIPDTTETDETMEILSVDDIIEADDPEPEPEEDVPFVLIEDAPVFPGCKGNNNALKTCFNKKMQQHFLKKFDANLPNELGLFPGRKKLTMLFKIDKTGKIIDVRVVAPHPKLQKEATRVINLLPKMKPGMQRGKPVGVKYTLPMSVVVE